jgi:hypothetical protein
LDISNIEPDQNLTDISELKHQESSPTDQPSFFMTSNSGTTNGQGDASRDSVRLLPAARSSRRSENLESTMKEEEHPDSTGSPESINSLEELEVIDPRQISNIEQMKQDTDICDTLRERYEE